MFLTPHIILTPEEGRKIYEGKRKELQEMIDRTREGQDIEPLRRLDKDKQTLEDVLPPED